MGGIRRRTAVIFAGVVLIAGTVGAGIGYAASTVAYEAIAKLRVVQSDFTDGFDSGWHTHPGPIIVQVQEGSFKFYQGSCEPVVVGKGQTFIEIPAVPIRAVATGRIKWTTSMILPTTELFPQTAAASPCP
jgi:quercetin dioxygenase-like cupin family protein